MEVLFYFDKIVSNMLNMFIRAMLRIERHRKIFLLLKSGDSIHHYWTRTRYSHLLLPEWSVRLINRWKISKFSNQKMVRLFLNQDFLIPGSETRNKKWNTILTFTVSSRTTVLNFTTLAIINKHRLRSVLYVPYNTFPP